MIFFLSLDDTDLLSCSSSTILSKIHFRSKVQDCFTGRKIRVQCSTFVTPNMALPALPFLGSHRKMVSQVCGPRSSPLPSSPAAEGEALLDDRRQKKASPPTVCSLLLPAPPPPDSTPELEPDMAHLQVAWA